MEENLEDPSTKTASKPTTRMNSATEEKLRGQVRPSTSKESNTQEDDQDFKRNPANMTVTRRNSATGMFLSLRHAGEVELSRPDDTGGYLDHCR